MSHLKLLTSCAVSQLVCTRCVHAALQGFMVDLTHLSASSMLQVVPCLGRGLGVSAL